MTELSFLLSLLFKTKGMKAMKEAIQQRIVQIETRQPFTVISPSYYSGSSTRGPDAVSPVVPHDTIPAPPIAAGQTPLAANALAQRQQAISIAVSGKSEPGRTSPRKF